MFFYWIKSLFGWNGLSLLALGLMIGAVAVSFYHSLSKSNFWFASLWMIPDDEWTKYYLRQSGF